jgi:hypothetical protein
MILTNSSAAEVGTSKECEEQIDKEGLSWPVDVEITT